MLSKGLNLLAVLAEHPDGVGVSELARETDLPVSTVHWLLGIMVSLGFVTVDEHHREYLLGTEVFELGNRVPLVKTVSDAALPVMQLLTGTTREPTLMAVRDGSDLVYVEREVGPSRVQIRRFVGGRGPLHCTALGKSLLAFLPDDEREAVVGELELQPFMPSTITDTDALRAELDRTRERGYAVADEEYEPGVREVGAPILGARNQPVAAISLVAASLRVSWENLERYVPSLRHAAQEITARIRDVRLPSW